MPMTEQRLLVDVIVDKRIATVLAGDTFNRYLREENVNWAEWLLQLGLEYYRQARKHHNQLASHAGAKAETISG